MSTSRVKYLGFSVSSDAHTCYDDPKPHEFDAALGRFCLRKDRLTFFPTEDFASVEDARAAVEPFLRAWETEAALRDLEGVIRFRYSDAELQSLDPVGSGDVVLSASVSVGVRVSDTLLVTVTKAAYPHPSGHFALIPEVEIATRRWHGYRAGREPLQSVGYFILTILEERFGSRPKAAVALDVDDKILRHVGRLTSTAGNPDTARKMAACSRSLLDVERAWLEAVIPLLILRLAERAAGASLRAIEMSDFPSLPP